MDRANRRWFTGYQVPNVCYSCACALPSPRSRQLQRILQVGCKGCPMVLQVLQDCIISIVLQIVLQVSFFRLISGFVLRLQWLAGRNRVALARSVSWLFSADPKRSHFLLAKCPFYPGFSGGIEAFYVGEIYNSICHVSSRRTSRVGFLTSFTVQTSAFGIVAQMAL